MDSVVAASHDALSRGSKSFGAAARLFDRRTRESVYMLYAWCRHCDDVIDGQVLGFRPPAASDPSPGRMANDLADSPAERLATLRRETARALAMEAVTDPVFVAFQRVVSMHAIPSRYPLELLEGFAMDVAGRRYETLEETLVYCYHVAGVVGIMMSMVMGATEQRTLDRACDLGIAFQLTNIARDVIEDARVDRVYLPRSWLAAAGVAENAMTERAMRPRIAGVTRQLLAEADRYYRSAQVGLAHLPWRSAWAIAAALRIYRAIGIDVVSRGPGAWDERVRVGGPRKVVFAALGGLDALRAQVDPNRGRDLPRTGLWTRT
ncbi:MAG: phytoene/squalene synthase family protein [Burkholderiales bacterium]